MNRCYEGDALDEGDIPQFHRLVVTPGRQVFPIQAECNTRHRMS